MGKAIKHRKILPWVYIIAIINMTLYPYHADAVAFQNGYFNTGTSRPAAGATVSICDPSTGLTGWNLVTQNDGCVSWIRSPATTAKFSGVYPTGVTDVLNLTRDEIFQEFTTVIGQTYNVSFMYANGTSVGASCKLFFGVRNMTGYTLADFYNAPTYDNAELTVPANGTATTVWHTYTTSFVPTTTQTSFEIDSGSTVGYCTNLIVAKVVIAQASIPPDQSISKNYAVYDPSNLNLKAIPGNDVVTTSVFSNAGGPPDAGTLVITLSVDTDVSFKVGSVTYTDNAGANATGLTCCGGVGQLLYSDTGTSGPWTYTPTGTYDPNVRAVQIKPTGTMNTGSVGTPVGFITTYQAQIK